MAFADSENWHNHLENWKVHTRAEYLQIIRPQVPGIYRKEKKMMTKYLLGCSQHHYSLQPCTKEYYTAKAMTIYKHNVK